MKRLRWLFTVPLALILIVFAVNNRHLVDVSLWPLGIVISWPLFVFVYIGVVAGFAGGAIIAWVSAAQRHRRARQRRTDKQVRASEAVRVKDEAEIAKGAGTTSPALID
ncbi:MAG: DUF1049 domain-containing protein [Alphaproteobacteria bacterium]|nr:DUF1049 domain-containing protein [Alphaproteobacteria bacterium]